MHIKIASSTHTEIYKHGYNCEYRARNSFLLKVIPTEIHPFTSLTSMTSLDSSKATCLAWKMSGRGPVVQLLALYPEGTEMMSETTDFSDKNKVRAKIYQ